MLSGFEREQKILDNIGLVHSIMKSFFYDTDDKDDIFSEGMIGLIQAVDRFDPTFENQFSSFAHPYIRGKMLDYFRRKTFDDSLDDPIFNNDGEETMTKLDTLISDDNIQQSYEDDETFKFRMGIIEKVLSRVSEQQEKAYRLMMSGMTFSDIARELNVSNSRPAQLIGTVDRRLNQYIFERGLRYV